jgi:CelD/BcsL family acetyltransferase involved in cellulose biosynthesis
MNAAGGRVHRPVPSPYADAGLDLTVHQTDWSAAISSAAPPPAAEAVRARPEGARIAPFAAFRADPRLMQDWQQLERAATLPTQSRAFATALARTLLSDQAVHIAYQADAGGIAALLPLCRDAGRFARWRMIGEREVFESSDALLRDADAAQSLAETIAGQSRPVDLDRIPASSPLIPALRVAMSGRGLMLLRPAIPSPRIALDESWIDPASRFNSGRRSDFRRAARKAGEQGAVAFEMLAPGPDEFDALFDEAIAVELRSWKREAGSALAVDQPKALFFRDFFRTAAAEGTLRIAFMRIDGQVVAMQLALESLARFWLFKIGFDEEFARCSPGTLLMLHTIGWAAGRGLGGYELLGNVEPWIAQLWTREQRDCVRLRTYPFNAGGARAFAGDALIFARQKLSRGSG